MDKLPYLIIGKFLLLLVLVPFPSNAIGPWAIISTGKEILQEAIGAYNTMEEIHQEMIKTDVERLTPAQGETLRKLDSIYWDLGDLKNDIRNWQKREEQKEIANKIDEMMTKVNIIHEKYEEYERFRFNNTFIVNNRTVKVEPEMIKTFAESVISFDIGQFSDIVKTMYTSFHGKHNLPQSILGQLSQNTTADFMCIRNQSAQQFILELFRILVEADKKALIIKFFAFNELEKYKDPHYYEYSRITEEEKFAKRIDEAKSLVMQNIGKASRVVWRCDPPVHQKNLTYTKLGEVFQTYAYHERDFDNTCSKSCSDYSYTKRNGLKTSPECNTPFCKKHSERKRCHGKLIDCQKIHKTQKYCFSPETSDRRYDWMLTGSQTSYGPHDIGCEDTIDVDERHAREIISGMGRTLILTHECDTCVCTCVSERRGALRNFALNSIYSDVDRNMIVTGVRFVEYHHVIYLQIQQGILGPNGHIDQNSLEWTNDYFYYRSFEVDEKHNTVFLDDIVSPSEKNKNSSDLQEEYVICGVALDWIDNNLRLKAFFVPYDYKTGTLYHYRVSNETYYGNDKPRDKREKLSLLESADPTKTNNNLLDSTHGQRVEFQTTGLKRDFGQSTIPYIDLQDVVSNPAVPLVGLGLMHKGTPGYGGFLGLKLIQYDYTKHL